MAQRLPEHEYRALYTSTPEYAALFADQQDIMARLPEWRGFVASLRAIASGCNVYDATPPYEGACFVARVDYTRAHPESSPDNRFKTLTVCVSLLAPVYLLHEAHTRQTGHVFEPVDISFLVTPDAAPIAEVVEQAIAERFGYQRLSPALAVTRVPGNLEPGEATLADALFTPHRW